MRRRMGPGSIALAVLAVLTVVLGVLAIQKQNAGPPTAGFAAPQDATGPIPVSFVADGYTSGVPGGGAGPANYTALLAGRDRWRVTNPAVYGAGYVAGPKLESQLPRAAGAGPRLVVVSGGRADDGSDPAAVRDAAGRLYRDLRGRSPQAAVVVIGPIWLGDEPPRAMRDVRDAIRDSATAAGLPFVDPLAERWFNGRDEDGIAQNGVDLNDRGHQRMAELVDDAVRRSGAMPD